MTPPPCYTTRQQWNRHAYVTLLYLTQLSEVQALVKMVLYYSNCRPTIKYS